MQIDLNDEDVQLLKEVLGGVISDLSPEIADTDNAEYRRLLRDRRTRLQTILASLSTPA